MRDSWAFAQDFYAFCLVFIFPLIDLRQMRRLKQHTSSRARIAAYRFGVIAEWSCAVLALLLLRWRRLVPSMPAGASGWPLGRGWPFVVALSLVCAYFLLGLYPGFASLRSSELRAKYGRALKSLRFLLPVAPQERLWFALLSITAGVCEEVLYRGFLFLYLHGQLEGGLHLGVTAAWLLSSLAFGTAHLYQGIPGIVRCMVAGLAFGLTAIFTGGLVIPMLLHVLVDLQVLVMYRPVEDAPQDAQRLLSEATL